MAWGTSLEEPALSVIKPFDGQPDTVGNEVTVALQMDFREPVSAFHAKAAALCAKDEGEPGPRGEGFYAGYFRDLDGNELNAFVMG